MNERERWRLKTVLILRRQFRECFEWSLCQNTGYFTDHYLSAMVHSYADWVHYPKHDSHFEWDARILQCAVISSDGYSLFTASDSGTIACWNLESTEQRNQWSAHENTINAVRYHPSSRLGCASADGSLSVWNALSFALIHRFIDPRIRPVFSVSFNPSGDRIISGSKDSSILVWSIETGKCVSKLSGHSSSVMSVHWIRDFIISASSDQSIRLWNASDEREIHSVHQPKYATIAVNCDCTLLACLSVNGAEVCSLPTMESVGSIALFSSNEGCFHPCNPSVLALSCIASRSVHIFDIRLGERISRFQTLVFPLSCLSFTPDGRRLVVMAFGGGIQYIDTSSLFS